MKPYSLESNKYKMLNNCNCNIEGWTITQVFLPTTQRLQGSKYIFKNSQLKEAYWSHHISITDIHIRESLPRVLSFTHRGISPTLICSDFPLYILFCSYLRWYNNSQANQDFLLNQSCDLIIKQRICLHLLDERSNSSAFLRGCK